MAPDPYRFANLVIEALIGGKKDGQFSLSEEDPTLRVTVTNKNPTERRVFVDVHAESPGILVAGRQDWRSEEQLHGGRKSPGKQQCIYEAPLRFVYVGDHVLQIAAYMCGLGEDDPIIVGDFDYPVSVS